MINYIMHDGIFYRKSRLVVISQESKVKKDFIT